MLTTLYYALVLTLFYFAYLIVRYASNAITLRKLGFPVVHVPLMVQNGVPWMIFSPIIRPWMKRRLPSFIFDRLAFTIYGVEFHQKHISFEEYINPKMHANPKLVGNGKTYTLATSGRLELWTWDADIAKEVCSRTKDFTIFDMVGFILGIFGDNVFTTIGSEWARHRRIVAGAVTERVSSVVWNESVRQAKDLMAAVTRPKGDQLDGQSASGTTYRLFDYIKRTTIHVLYAAGMGKTQDFSTNIDLKDTDGLPSDVRLSYFDAVRIINENTAGPVIFPTPMLRYWPSFLPGAAWLNTIGQAKVDFTKHTHKNLAQERDLNASLSEPRNNVMSALLIASEQDQGDPEKGLDKSKNSNGSQKNAPALSDAELVGNLYIFTAAGFDTTANTIAYSLMLLTRNPRWQDWLFEELDNLIPDPSSPSAFEYQTVFPSSNRTLAVMFEALRLYPAVIHITRQTTSPQSVTLPSGHNFTVPANTTIYINSVALHTDPATWRNLNMTKLELRAANDDEDNILQDEHIFRPSRWINPDGSIFKPPPGTYLPWSAGPRVCPGMRMAQVEYVGIMNTLFARHRLEAVRGTKTVRGGDEVHEIPESDDALRKRLDDIMDNATPLLTLEMDVYNVKEDAPGGRGLGMRWVGRR